VALLLVTPAAMHVTTCLRRIVSSYASSDDFFDWILVTVVPYLMLYGMVMFLNGSCTNGTNTVMSPYQAAAQHILPGAGMGNNTLRGTALPAILSVVTSWALQHR
jgi:ATP/ADP translocase